MAVDDREFVWSEAVRFADHVADVIRRAGAPSEHVEKERAKYLEAKRRQLFGESS